MYYESHYCQKCGEMIGWLGRIMPLHNCKKDKKRQWVGLTHEDIEKAGKLNVEGERMLPFSFAFAVEAILKEKNT